MSLLDIAFGRPLASGEEEQQRVGPLASAAYGPEAALWIWWERHSASS